MAKVVSLICAMLLMFTATPQAGATPTTRGSCVSVGESLESMFNVWGESEHWVVILQGVGSCQEQGVHTAKALPYLVWAGGDQIPEHASVRFTVQNLTCIQGTVGVQPSKVVRVADCKLVFPGQQLLVAKRPEDLVKAITADGRFVVTWDGMTEQVTWRYGYPLPARDSR